MNATKAMTLLAAVAVGLSAQALTLAVKDVKIAQRYPWNGLVDIDYTVECDDKDADVYIYPVGYDADNNQSVALYTFTGEGANGKAVKAGTHRMTWDMAKDMGQNYNRAAFSIKLHGYAGAAPYLVIDLSSGANAEKYEVSYLNEMPEGGWTDEYKTTKLVLKLIPPGTFLMGTDQVERDYYYYSNTHGFEDAHWVTLTEPFYIGVFEITQKQYAQIAGGTQTSTAGANGLSYDFLRGNTLGGQFPKHMQVDATSFLGKLRSRTGVTFDLPTEAQWEYACRAGSRESVSPNPNAFGLYGMNAKPAEWCRDWFNKNATYTAVTNPVGPASGYRGTRSIRGGAYTRTTNKGSMMLENRSSARVFSDYYDNDNDGFKPNRTQGAVYTSENSFGCRLVALPAAK